MENGLEVSEGLTSSLQSDSKDSGVEAFICDKGFAVF